jgi:hypothetical protein
VHGASVFLLKHISACRATRPAQLIEHLPKKDRLFVIENAKRLAEFLKDKNEGLFTP